MLGECRVLEYAVLDESVTYSGHSSIFLGNASEGFKELGPVPCLAIGQELKSGDIMLLHCDREWDVLARGGNDESPAKARDRAERIYHGVASRWIGMNVSESDARKYNDESWADSRCSFCGKLPPDLEMLVEREDARICDACVARFHELMQEQRSKK